MIFLIYPVVVSLLLLSNSIAAPENGGIFAHPDDDDEWNKYGCGTDAEVGMAACFCGFLRDEMDIQEGDDGGTGSTAMAKSNGNIMIGVANAIASSPAATCQGGLASSYPCKNVDLLAHLPLSKFGSKKANDVWGWTHSGSGREFAIIALSDGTAFVEITNPTNPVYLGKLPTHTTSSSWRDVKTYKDHAFIGSEADNHGMQVFDLTQLLTKIGSSNFQESAHYGRIGNSHNIAINEGSGYAYVVGSNKCSGGLHMVDILNPKSPQLAGCFSSDGYTHDANCVMYNGPDSVYKGKEICFACNEDTITVVDVTNKNSPVQLSRVSYAKNGKYDSHNVA
jgi:choice-of-anchor B domain-containing protein